MMHKYQFPIESDRLYFEPMGQKDTKAWEAFFINNDQLSFVGIDRPESPTVEAVRWIERQVARYEISGVGILGAYSKEGNELIGNCGLIWREQVLGEDLFEIGYAVLPEAWGKGYASEMSNRFMQYFIDHQLGKKVMSIIALGNIASQKIAMKNGMKKGKQFEFQGAQCYQFVRQFDNHW